MHNSLRLWRVAAATAKANTTGARLADGRDPIAAALGDQGQQWRDILCGRLAAKDVLRATGGIPDASTCPRPSGSSVRAPPAERTGQPEGRHAVQRGTTLAANVGDVSGRQTIHTRGPRSAVSPHPAPRRPAGVGIGHEIEQIVEPTITIINSPTVQLRLDPQYPRPRLPDAPPRQCSPTTSRPSSPSTANLLPSFAMCRAFPRLGLMRRLRPAPALPADDVPARPSRTGSARGSEEKSPFR